MVLNKDLECIFKQKTEVVDTVSILFDREESPSWGWFCLNLIQIYFISLKVSKV